MKKLKFRAIGLVCATLFAGSAMAQQVTLRLHQFLPPQATIPAKAIIPWAQKVEKESGGKIKVQMFHAMQMGGSPAQLFDQAKDGVADITWTVLGYTPGRFVKTEVTLPLFRVVLSPMVTRLFYAVPRTSVARTASG